MSTLVFDASHCVRSVTKFSACSACVDICPVDTMTIGKNGLPTFIPSSCVDCGGCVGACPSESLALGIFDTTDFFFNFVQDEQQNLLSCKSNVPCLSVFSVDHLISMALMKDVPVELDLGHCASCSIKEPLYDEILKNIEEANFILEAIESNKQLDARAVVYTIEEEEKGSEGDDRRAFLSHLTIKGALQGKKAFDEAVEGSSDEMKAHSINLIDVAKMRQKALPDKRKILFMALKRAPKPSVYHTVSEDDITFSSQKSVDMQSCTNCQMCYRICPTGALSSDEKNSAIFFDTMLCIKCRACHDTCEPDALKLKSVFHLKEFFEPSQQQLAKFSLKRCHECGMTFTSLHGETVCPRCAVEEEEALELWGLTKKSDGTIAINDEKKPGENQ